MRLINIGCADMDGALFLAFAVGALVGSVYGSLVTRWLRNRSKN